MAGIMYAAEVAREDAMGGSYVEKAWTREELAGIMRLEWPTLAPGTRVDYYALPYEVGFESHSEADAWADEQIHDGAEPVASVFVQPLARSEAEREAWQRLADARGVISEGDMWGHPHYNAREVRELLDALDAFAEERPGDRQGESNEKGQ